MHNIKMYSTSINAPPSTDPQSTHTIEDKRTMHSIRYAQVDNRAATDANPLGRLHCCSGGEPFGAEQISIDSCRTHSTCDFS